MKDIATPFLEMYIPAPGHALWRWRVRHWRSASGRGSDFLGLGLLLVTAVLLPFHLGDTAGGVSAPLLMAGALCGAWLLRSARARPDRAGPIEGRDGRRRLHGGVRPVVCGRSISLVSDAARADARPARGIRPVSPVRWRVPGDGPPGRIPGATASPHLGVHGDRHDSDCDPDVGWPDVQLGRIGVTSGQSIGGMFFVWLVAIAASQGLYNRDLPAPARVAMLAAGTLALVRSLVFWPSRGLPGGSLRSSLSR